MNRPRIQRLGSLAQERVEVPADALEMPPAVAEKLSEYRRVVAAHAEAQGDVEALAVELANAADADRQSAATALRAGKDAPTAKAAKVEARLADARFRADALALAVDQLRDETKAAAEQHRTDWLAALEARAEAERQAYTDVIDAMEQARAALGTTYSSLAWLSSYPNGKAVSLDAYRNTRMATIRGANGDGRLWSEVVDALRSDAEPPKAPSLPTMPIPAAQTPPAPPSGDFTVNGAYVLVPEPEPA